MTIREDLEQWEESYLSPYASYSSRSQGRDREEEPCDLRPVYERDRDRILHCKAFRRLKHKTQVFLAPQGDHYRTRLTHTLEVSQIARTVAKALRLNEDLTEAIALGHDLGHTPFGHAGERALNAVADCGFTHPEQSVRVVELLEKKGDGLNLTKEVRDGIRNHRTSGQPATLEGQIVRFSDKIAYINHDIDDSIRGGIIAEEDIPLEYREILGFSCKERLNTLIHDIIRQSMNTNDVHMSKHIMEAMAGLRKYMFASVYTNPKAKGQEYKAENMVQVLFSYYMEHVDELPQEYRFLIDVRGERKDRVVCDYISGMTDQFAIATFEHLYIPTSWRL